jgi:hypothetical protein
MSPEQKSIAIWKFLKDWRYHYSPAEGYAEVHDPVKFLTVYGYGFCDDSARNFANLCEVAGMKARVWGLNGHVVAESFFDGAWHMFDADHECYFRAADNHILSVEELARDPSAMLKTPTDPVGFSTAELAKLYTTTEDNAVVEREEFKPAFRVDPALQPGDEAVFDLGPARLVHTVYARKEAPPPKAANGALTRKVAVTAADGDILIPVKWPYVIVGGELTLTLSGDARAEVALSVDGRVWAPVEARREGPPSKAGGKAELVRLKVDLTPFFVAQDAAYYAYTLRLRSADGTSLRAAVKDAELTTIFQFAPKTLPQVQPGPTTFEVALASPAGPLPADWKGIEVIVEWVEPTATSAGQPGQR